jgi:hypothetical protein
MDSGRRFFPGMILFPTIHIRRIIKLSENPSRDDERERRKQKNFSHCIFHIKLLLGTGIANYWLKIPVPHVYSPTWRLAPFYFRILSFPITGSRFVFPLAALMMPMTQSKAMAIHKPHEV